MAKSRYVSWSTATMMLLLLGSSYAAVELSDILAELQHERDSSLDGVIHVSEDSFKRFSAGKQRPYSLIVFLTARQVLDNPQLAMESLRKEYGLAAAATRSGPEPDLFFFLEAVFEESPRVFQTVNANQVPFIWRVAPNKKVNLNSEFPLDDHDKMTFQSVGSRHKYPWKAEDMIAYFGKTGLVAAEVNRPSILKSPWLPFLVVAFGVGLVLLAYLVWRLRLLHHPLPWAVGAILVFWFSVSGGMYNIIRGMPMFIRDKQGKIQFFLGGRGAQLGAEGFIVGSGYVLFSAAISLVTFAVPRVKNNTTRNVLSYALVTAAAYMALKLFGVFVTKTGYHVSTYLMR